MSEQKTNLPPTNVDAEELFKTDKARGITLSLLENGAFSYYAWFGGVRNMDWQAGHLEVMYDDDEGDRAKFKRLEFGDLLSAAEKLRDGTVKINRTIRHGVSDALVGDFGHWDIDAMDAVVQVAVFGEVVYG